MLRRQNYNWKRFWYPREKKISLADGGYLPDPDSKYGHYLSSGMVSFDSIVDNPCLVLLGEPGIGKSTAIVHASQQVDKTGEVWLKFDLGEYQSDTRLCDKVFGDQTFKAWLKGTHRLHLFLDSLDEERLAINNLAKILASELKGYPCDRLLLRITCRTAEWSNHLEEKLRQLWGKEAVEVYNMAPLRRVDVSEAAKAKNLDPNAFLDEIYNKEVVPLAIKPVTLNFLLDTYKKNGQFPSTQKELYFQGCRSLCEEINEDRRDAQLTGNLTGDQRMIVAARIASVTVFANRSAIWTGINQEDVSDIEVTVRDFCGGIEKAIGIESPVNENEVKEALGTGLFSSYGSHRMGWAHQSYAEFLAAWYLVQHEIPLVQAMSLIVSSEDPERKLVPQLHETAAWLAGMMPDVFREVLKADPDVLLRSDVATADVRDREALVENLLKLYDEEKLLNGALGNYSRYRKLEHPGLVKQLRPYIRDLNKGFEARYVAIDITEACELQELQDDLADVALDSSQPQRIRLNAVSAICKIGNEEVKARLKPLAIGEAGDNSDAGLKHYALQALWPDHIIAEELFSALTPSNSVYQKFIFKDFVQYLQPVDLPAALEWVKKQNPLHQSFEKLVDAILLKAWEHLESPGVLKAFAKIAFFRLKEHDEIIDPNHESSFEQLLKNDDKKRRQLIEAIVSIVLNSEENPLWLDGYRTSLILHQDFLWMLERFQALQLEREQQVWAKLIWRRFIRYVPEQVNAILTVSQNSPILKAEFAPLIEKIKLDSPRAEQERAYYLQEQKWQNSNKNQSLLKPPPKERVITLLDKFESGDTESWQQLCHDMTLKLDSNCYGNLFSSDLTTLPGWIEAEATTKVRIIEAAKVYVHQVNPENQEWLGTNSIYPSALAGYEALRLLLQEEPNFISTISVEAWKRWTPIILESSKFSDGRDEKTSQELVKKAYQSVATEFINTLMILIDKENQNYNQIFITNQVKVCWDQNLENALLIKVKDDNLKLKSLSCLLEELLEHKVKEAETFAKSFIGLPSSFSGYRRAKAIVAAWTLINHAEDAGWSVVWPAIQRDYKFGRKVFETASFSDGQAVNIGQALSENQLANLYIWLVHQYPHAKDPAHEGVYSPRPRDNVAEFRDHVLGHLQERGNPQACEEIQRIINEFPKIDWLKRVLLEAQTVVRRRNWNPPLPLEIIKLASSQQVRLVNSGDQLLDVLVESLQRLEVKLQGETPAAIFLWDEIDRKVYRPKDENTFSDFVKLHLDEDLKQRGIIINREVELRCSRGSAPGERTDIHVDAVTRGQDGQVYDSVTVIIEVKGCWNPELKDAMKTQLVDRYLNDNSCQYGLYLVGWFNCPQWDNDDYKKKRAPKISLYDARDQFNAQAAMTSEQGIQVKVMVINAALR